jgi:hypothetical protein
MSGIDNYILSSAMASSDLHHPFVEKKVLVLDDKSNGNYTTEIRFESGGLSSALSYLNWSEGVIVIPIVMSVSSAATFDFTTGGGLYTDYMMCLKNSYMTLIDRMTIWSGSNTVVSQVQNINQYLNFRLLTELSEDDEKIWGDVMNFHPDNAAAFSFNSTASSRGNGVSNNVFGASEANNFLGIQNQYFNDGAFKRCNKFVNKSDSDRSALFSNSNLGAMGYDYIENLATAKNYYLTAFIRLKDIPFFKDLPLLMGSLFKISLSINQGSVKIYRDASGNLMQNSNTFTSGSCCPLLVSSSSITIKSPTATSATAQSNTDTWVAGGASNLPSADAITIALGVTKVTSGNGTTYSHSISNCRIYVPTYKMDEQVLQNYISMGMKRHVYSNVVHSLFNVGAGNSFTQTINTRSRITRIIIIPEIAQSGNGTAVATNGALVQQKYSPFDIFPAGTAPCAAAMLSKLKIMVGGAMVWNNEVNYGWEHFLFETLNYGVNGGQSNGVSSGRITKNGFDGEYSYIVCNVRNSTLDYSKPMQVDIAGTSLCTKDLILNCFIEYEASCEFDLTTGAMSNLVD